MSVVTRIYAPLLLVASFASVASAQSSGYLPAIREGHYGPHSVYRHASTYEEGVLRGTADLYRGVGDLRYSSSLANVNNQEAYRRYLENRLKATETYFQMRKINKENRTYDHPTQEELKRYSEARKPARLPTSAFNPATGELAWPAALSTGEYALARARLEDLLATYPVTADSAAAGAAELEVVQLLEEMETRLAGQIRELPANQYMQAKRFLNGLEREVTDPRSSSGLASR